MSILDDSLAESVSDDMIGDLDRSGAEPCTNEGHPFAATPWIDEDLLTVQVKNWRDSRLAQIRSRFEAKKVRVGRAGLCYIGPLKARVLLEPTHKSKVKITKLIHK